MSRKIDVVLSFDTTGSMYPCLAEVRRRAASLTKELFKEIPELRMGVIAHGDYCDKNKPYIMTGLNLSMNQKQIVDFINKVEPTFGGDWEECYELVLHHVQTLDWRSDADSKVFVMIGDATPHYKGYRYGSEVAKHDWRQECELLSGMGIQVHAVQAMGRHGRVKERNFYEAVAGITNGVKIDLAQLGQIVQLIMAICYKESSDEQFQAYEKKVAASPMFNRSLAAIFDAVAGRKKTVYSFKVSTDLDPVEPARFQTIRVEGDAVIKHFVVDEMGAKFKTGKGFYQWTKRETIQERKEVVLRDKKSGDMWTGSVAREMIGLPYGERGRLSPSDLPEYDVFVQSTSWNRKLKGGTDFLYESDEWERMA